jgi:hypothetical protein
MVRIISTSVALTFALVSPVWGQSRGTSIYTPGRLTPAQHVAHDILKELLEINSSVTTGNITNAAVAMAKRFREAGILESDPQLSVFTYAAVSGSQQRQERHR